MKIFFNMELGKYCNLSNVIIVIHIFVLCPFYIFILKAIKFTICKKKKTPILACVSVSAKGVSKKMFH